MRIRILDLDGSVSEQSELGCLFGPEVLPAREWGPRLRMACSFSRFRKFEHALAGWTGSVADLDPGLTFCGSGDFHHVSLALIRRLQMPINLVVLDNHPDWMRGVPFIHCGTWLYHAAQLPQVRRIYHFGGDVDFDNSYRWMAPWQLLHSEKMVVFPARRCFSRGAWNKITNLPLKQGDGSWLTLSRLQQILKGHRADLASYPLYISLDKDVMTADEAPVNWDSGHLSLAEVLLLIRELGEATEVAGMDVVGDWSPVELRGGLGRLMHWTEHPSLAIDAGDASRRNECVNLALIHEILLRQWLWRHPVPNGARLVA